MALKIVRAAEPMPVDNIVLTIYAAPGYGKTTLGMTGDKALTLDFDKGAYRAARRGDAVPVLSWSDVQGMTADDLKDYNTIVVDTAGRALDALAADIIAMNPKAGRGDGSLTLQGFGTLKSRFAQWQGFLRSLGKDLVLICHMDEQRSGDDTIERIDAQGASKNEIYKSSDAMCRIRLDGRDGRFLDFNPRSGGFGKNPAQLPLIPFPHPDHNPHFLADVVQQIKDSINKITTAQAEAVTKQATEEKEWREAIAEAKTIEQFNSQVVPMMKERKGAFLQLAKSIAKERGYKANKSTGLYEAAEQKAA